MNKNYFNTIKAIVLLVIISLLTVITVFQAKQKHNNSNAITEDPETTSPTYKNASSSLNPDLSIYNTISGSNNDILENVIIKDNYFLIGNTNSNDYDFNKNTNQSIFVSKFTKSLTLINTIFIEQARYISSIDFGQNLGILLQIQDEYRLMFFDTELNQTNSISLNYSYDYMIFIDYLYLYDTEQSIFSVLQEGSFIDINLGYINFEMQQIIKKDSALYIILENNELVYLKLLDNELTPILSLEIDKLIDLTIEKDAIIASTICENLLVITKIDFYGEIIFSYSTGFVDATFVKPIKQTNGYNIYISNSKTSLKVFICLHGDEIERQLLEFVDIKLIYLENESLTIIATNLSQSTSVIKNDIQYTINGGAVQNVFYYPVLNTIFCYSESSLVDFCDNKGKNDIFIFKLNSNK